ncbi:unnamed protein product [Cercopithifilaria johnstoni]|uniref:Uncharacterized protein n=1 Tax=Cercopithifilaria johnstoni TaxID=2874296 RepID=A0A8J2Q3H5_9BILA|nr:unnamed protein product [Cercopithifilaria johnstoni]
MNTFPDDRILARGPPNAFGSDDSSLADYSANNPPAPLCASTPVEHSLSLTDLHDTAVQIECEDMAVSTGEEKETDVQTAVAIRLSDMESYQGDLILLNTNFVTTRNVNPLPSEIESIEEIPLEPTTEPAISRIIIDVSPPTHHYWLRERGSRRMDESGDDEAEETPRPKKRGKKKHNKKHNKKSAKKSPPAKTGRVKKEKKESGNKSTKHDNNDNNNGKKKRAKK